MTRKHKTAAIHPSRDAAQHAAASAKSGVSRLRSIVLCLAPPRVALFVALFVWYLWAIVDLRLVFNRRDLLFLWNTRYLTDFIGQPGSLLEWCDKLFVQLCYWGWPGAIALGTVVWILLVSTIGLMNVVGRANLGGTWVIPGLLLLSIYGSYGFPTTAVVGLAVAIAAANLWCRLPVRRNSLRLILFVVVSVGLYCLAGVAYYCFAACCVIHEGLAERRRLSATLFVLAAVAVKFAEDALLARLSLASHNFSVAFLIRLYPVPLDPRVAALYLYFPACALFAVYSQAFLAIVSSRWRRLRKPREDLRSATRDRSEQQHHGTGGPALDRGPSGIVSYIRWCAATALTLALFAAVGFCSLNRTDKLLQEISYSASYRQWKDVLAKVESLPPGKLTPEVAHDVNRALYHTGRLPYRLLSYRPQVTFDESPSEVAFANKAFSLLYELGRINEAERLALETIETHPTGAAIRHLAMTKMIKRQPAAARVMLNVLLDDLVWGDWARDRLRRLAEDPNSDGDEEMQALRELMLTEDDLHVIGRPTLEGITINSGAMLASLLERNGANRMAFEYLMAMCLIDGHVQGVVDLFPFLDNFSYSPTPPLYEEAVMVYLASHPEDANRVGEDIYCRGRKISVATLAKYRRLQEIAAASGTLGKKEQPVMARELGGSYFYYYFYNHKKRP